MVAVYDLYGSRGDIIVFHRTTRSVKNMLRWLSALAGTLAVAKTIIFTLSIDSERWAGLGDRGSKWKRNAG